VLFAALGLGCWIAPDLVAARLGLDAQGVAGLSTLRADLGGFFLPCQVSASRASTPTGGRLLIVAGLVLSTAVVGRLISLAITGNAAACCPTCRSRSSRLSSWPCMSAACPARRCGRVATLLVTFAAVVVAAGLIAGAIHLPKVQQALFARAAEQGAGSQQQRPDEG